MFTKILAAYQLTAAFQRERGPFKIIEDTRGKIYQFDAVGRPPRKEDDPPTEIELLLSCPHCFSFWAALAVTFILPTKVVEALGTWGGASLTFHAMELAGQAVYRPTFVATANASEPTTVETEPTEGG